MFPKALALLSVLALTVAVQAQGVVPQFITFSDDDIARAAGSIETAEAAMVDNPNLTKRGCVYDGCKCTKYDGSVGCYGNNVYQCFTSGECCNWGPRDACKCVLC